MFGVSVMVMRPHQIGLPLTGGGPTNLGYPTIFRPTPVPTPQSKSKVRATLTVPRARWLLQLHLGLGVDHRPKVQQDCLQLGWAEWVKDDPGSFELCVTSKGITAIGHLLPVKRRTVVKE